MVPKGCSASICLWAYSSFIYTQSSLNPLTLSDTEEWQLAPGESWDPAGRDWYEEALAKDKTVFVAPYLGYEGAEAEAGKLVTTVSTPIQNLQGQQVGVVAIDILTETIQKLVENSRPNEAAFIFMIDLKGNFTVHPDHQKIMKDNLFKIDAGQHKELAQKMLSGKQGSMKTSLFGEKGYVLYAPVSSAQWAVGIMVPETVIYGASNRLFLITMLVILIGLLVIWRGMSYITASIVDPIQQVAELSSSLEEGDLTNELEIVSDDEIGQMSGSLNKAVQSLSKLLDRTKAVVAMVVSAADSNTAAMGSVVDQMSNISATTEEISASLEESSASSQEITASSEEIQSQLEQVAHWTQEAFNNSQEVQNRAQKMLQETIKAKDEAMDIYQSVSIELEGALSEVQVVARIEELAHVITDIADQTHLLALNASIEAARAGEQGRGFAVVADEVKKLSVKSLDTAADIQKLTARVFSSVENLSQESRTLLGFINDKVITDYDKMVGTSKQYSSDANDFLKLSKDFSSSAEQISTAISEITQAITQTSAALAQCSTAVNEIADEVTKTLETAQQVAGVAGEIKSGSEELNGVVQQFKC